MPTFSVPRPGGPLVGDVTGEGPAVVLLHAGVADRRMWNPIVPGLAQTHRVVRYDLPGFGESPPATVEFQPVDDLAAVLDTLGLADVDLAGASMGGYVALDFTLAHPERVRSLALLAPGLPGFDFGPGMRRYWAAEAEALERGDIDATVALNLDQWVRGPQREWSPRLRAVAEDLRDQLRIIAINQASSEDLEQAAQPPALGRLDTVGVPTLVLIAESDPTDLVAIGELIAATVPGARAVRLPDTAHLPAMERPAETLTALLAHLAA